MVRRSLLSFAFICLVGATLAQQTSGFVYAITGPQKGESNWTEVKLIDLSTGSVLRSIYENNQPAQILNARTGQPIPVKTSGTLLNNTSLPFSTYSAACAYDKKHNRLYYTPMGINQLRYIDLNAKQPRIFYFEGEAFGNVANLQDEANHVTRMVIGADGNGYALTNDANHLLKFSTGKKPVITDLGNLVDDESNGVVSIHNKCSSWGGDMIADAFGNLYMFSARQAVFEINISKRIALFKGFVTGLPANYTTNGAAVDDNGNVIVSSANSIDRYYFVDLGTLKASAVPAKDKVFNTSDLASGNLAFQKEADKFATTVGNPLWNNTSARNEHITIYPNPVTERIFRLYFTNQPKGRYEVQTVDLTGRIINRRTIEIVNKIQVQEIFVNDNLTRGMYMVKLIDGKRKELFTDKILVF